MSDDDSDEWGMEELVIPPKKEGKAQQGTDTKVGNAEDDDDDDDWNVTPKPEPETTATDEAKSNPKKQEEGFPMIIVDVTQIDENIHSKFDRNSVNDATAASAMRKKIEDDYDTYAKKNSSLLANGTVIPCGSTVWRDALVRLRDERPGHYFVPIFPPKKK